MIAAIIRSPASEIKKLVAHAWKECPNCKYHIYNGDVSSQWQGLPVGVKFEPSDQELLTHLEGKVGSAASHAQIDDFIPTIEEVEGICYTHPKNLPGIKMDGSSSHFFHRISNAYDVGQRKRRKINNIDELFDPICMVPSQWQVLPVGVKFEPSDQELLTHLEVKVGSAASHAQIDDFIPTIEEVEGICYTHPKNLPGIKMDGSSSHFFHRISNAFDVGQRKRRKINNGNPIDSDEQIRWHKTGQSKPIFDNGVLKGWKKILVLHKGKKVKTNWTLHQYHLGVEKDEKHGELVVSRVFWQVKSNNAEKSQMHVADVESGSCAVEIDPTTPNMYPQQPCCLSGIPFEKEQNQDAEEPGSPAVEDFAALPPLCDADIHENPVPRDNPGMDPLPGFPDLDYTFHFPELFNFTDSLDWLNGNEA